MKRKVSKGQIFKKTRLCSKFASDRSKICREEEEVRSPEVSPVNKVVYGKKI